MCGLLSSPFIHSVASVCFVVCLISLAWALVLYARACSLIRPGHLPMTPAAILCRLLWRVGIHQNNKSPLYSTFYVYCINWCGYMCNACGCLCLHGL